MTPEDDPFYPTIKTPVARLALKFGRRGLILVSVGFLFFLYGIGLAFDVRAQSAFSPHKDPIIDWVGHPLWGLLWMGSALLCFYAGFRRKKHSDVVGYTAAFIPPATWTVFFFYSQAVWFLTGGDFGLSTAWLGATVWIDFAFLVRVCAGWDDPTDPAARVRA